MLYHSSPHQCWLLHSRLQVVDAPLLLLLVVVVLLSPSRRNALGNRVLCTSLLICLHLVVSSFPTRSLSVGASLA